MTAKDPLKKSIQDRLQAERYKPAPPKKEKKGFDVQLILIVAIIIALLLSLVQLIK